MIVISCPALGRHFMFPDDCDVNHERAKINMMVYDRMTEEQIEAVYARMDRAALAALSGPPR